MRDLAARIDSELYGGVPELAQTITAMVKDGQQYMETWPMQSTVVWHVS
ncbi:hypothetical protein [uncultured Paraglaciecola sp.]|nr:hypothetical protein [uncultured Paraglaciecola sp.]